MPKWLGGLYDSKNASILINCYFAIISFCMFVMVIGDNDEMYYDLHGQQCITGTPMMILSALGVIISVNSVYGIYCNDRKVLLSSITWISLLTFCTVKALFEGVFYGVLDKEYAVSIKHAIILSFIAIFSVIHGYFGAILINYFSSVPEKSHSLNTAVPVL